MLHKSLPCVEHSPLVHWIKVKVEKKRPGKSLKLKYLARTLKKQAIQHELWTYYESYKGI